MALKTKLMLVTLSLLLLEGCGSGYIGGPLSAPLRGGPLDPENVVANTPGRSCSEEAWVHYSERIESGRHYRYGESRARYEFDYEKFCGVYTGPHVPRPPYRRRY